MALIVTFQNDATGTDDASNYDVHVYVNRKLIATERIIGHRRSDDWRALVRKLTEGPVSDGAEVRPPAEAPARSICATRKRSEDHITDPNVEKRAVISEPGAALYVERLEMTPAWKRQIAEALELGKRSWLPTDQPTTDDVEAPERKDLKA